MKRTRSARRDAEFTQFVEHTSQSLLRTAWLLCGDEGRAEDLVQEALMKVYSKWNDGLVKNPTAFARRAIINSNTDNWRKRVRASVANTRDDDVSGGHEPAFERTIQERAVLVDALRGLPRREREVVVLRYYADLSEHQVAVLLGTSDGTVKSSASRGISKLRKNFAEERSLP